MSNLGTKGKGGKEMDEEEEKRSNMMAKLDMVSVLEAKDIYDAVLQAFPTTLGKSVSKKEREELNLKTPNLVYGEITFETFGTIIEKIKKVYGLPGVGASGNTGVLQSRGGIFYDLGSGTGKPVVAAAILHNFDVCYGIEYLEGLYSVSLDALNSYNTKGKAKLASREHDTRKHCSVLFEHLLINASGIAETVSPPYCIIVSRDILLLTHHFIDYRCTDDSR